jgi:hypothetical protein
MPSWDIMWEYKVDEALAQVGALHASTTRAGTEAAQWGCGGRWPVMLDCVGKYISKGANVASGCDSGEIGVVLAPWPPPVPRAIVFD